jgi:hypothetical protein
VATRAGRQGDNVHDNRSSGENQRRSNFWTGLCEKSTQTAAKNGRKIAIFELLNWKSVFFDVANPGNRRQSPENAGFSRFRNFRTKNGTFGNQSK